MIRQTNINKYIVTTHLKYDIIVDFVTKILCKLIPKLLKYRMLNVDRHTNILTLDYRDDSLMTLFPMTTSY